MDFKKATELFADPDFDGDPVQIYSPEPGETTVPPDDENGENGNTSGNSEDGDMVDGDSDDEDNGRPLKYVVDDVKVSVVAERVQYYGKDGKLITESLKDYTRKAI